MRFALALLLAASALAAPLSLKSRYAPLASYEADVLAKRNCAVMPSKVDMDMVYIVYKTVLSQTKDPKLMLVTFITAYRESMFNNLNCGDKKSHGLFQQQDGFGWGSLADTMDPVKSTLSFLKVAIPTAKAHPNAGPGVIAQMVQQAEAGERYTENIGIGKKLIAQAEEHFGKSGGGGGDDGGDDNNNDDESTTTTKPKPKPEPTKSESEDPEPTDSSDDGGSINVGGNPHGGDDDEGGQNEDDGECDDSPVKCTQFYTPIPGDNCIKVSEMHNIELAHFYDINPEIDEHCQNLYAGKPYCVAVEDS